MTGGRFDQLRADAYLVRGITQQRHALPRAYGTCGMTALDADGTFAQRSSFPHRVARRLKAAKFSISQENGKAQ